MIRYRQIEAFRYVMVTGTMTGAADSMAISQPAISRLISDLEYHLKFKLFDRVKGRLIPTQEAMRFYQGVDQFYIGFDQLEEVAEKIRTQKPSDLKICATPALSTYVFPRVIEAFQRTHPNVNLLIESLSSVDIVHRLKTHMAHIGITTAFPEVPGIEQIPWRTTEHVCALHQSHPLAENEIITADDLTNEEILKILPVGFVNWQPVSRTLKKAGIKYSDHIGIQSSHTGYSMVAQNLAIAIIEPFAAPTWLNNGVVIRPFQPVIEFDYVIVRAANLPGSEAENEFIQQIQKLSMNINKYTV
jgi:DNA-binding transcriptional LysR family regulator